MKQMGSFKNKTAQALLAGLLSLLMGVGGSFASYASEVKWSDFGEVDRDGSSCWRGIAFQVSEEVTIDALYVSVGVDPANVDFEVDAENQFTGDLIPGDVSVALYAVDLVMDDGDINDGTFTINSLVGSALASTFTLNDARDIAPANLQPGTWYLLTGGIDSSHDEQYSDGIYVGTIPDVDQFDRDAVYAAHPFISEIFTIDDNPNDGMDFEDDCHFNVEELNQTERTFDDTSHFPAFGFRVGNGTKVDSLFAQDANFNQKVASCRRDFASDIQALLSPSLSRYESCMFFDVTKGNISRVNADLAAAYKASVTAGKAMTEAEIVAQASSLALRYNTIDRLIENPESVYATDLINIGLTGLNSVASKYQAINALRYLANQDKDTFDELQAAIAAMKKK
jgi:hypothetical protein